MTILIQTSYLMAALMAALPIYQLVVLTYLQLLSLWLPFSLQQHIGEVS